MIVLLIFIVLFLLLRHIVFDVSLNFDVRSHNDNIITIIYLPKMCNHPLYL